MHILYAYSMHTVEYAYYSDTRIKFSFHVHF